MKKVLMLLLAMTPIALQASLPKWQIIPAESELTFTATQNDAPVSGEFKKFGGEIYVDPTHYENSRIDLIVDMNSLSASYADLKDTLITADWFNIKLFPKAEFKADKFTKTGENTYQAIGTLTIRDQTKPVTLTFSTQQPSPNKGIVTGSAVIKRTSFGVGQGEWSGTDQIKDDVTVKFKVSATTER